MRFLTTALVIGMMSAPALADDVYNFYFQKSQNATEMTQVKNGVAASPTKANLSDVAEKDEAATDTKTPSPAAKTQIATKIEQPTEKEYVRKFWQVEVGTGQFADHEKRVSDGYSARLGYGFNKYFGLEGQLMGGGATASDKNISGEYFSYGTPGRSYFAGAFGMKVTPVHIEFFGFDLIDLSATAGAMTATGRDPGSAHDFRIAPYLGGAVAINLAERLAVVFDGKLEDSDNKFGQMSATLAYRF